MEIKKQKKRISKGLKRLRGGNWDKINEWFEKASNEQKDLFKGWFKPLEQKKLSEELSEEQNDLSERWFNFSNIVKKSTECENVEGCITTDEKQEKNDEMTVAEAQEIAAQVKERFKTQNETRTLVRTVPGQGKSLSIDEQKKNLIKDFDIIFEKILVIVSPYIGLNKLSTKKCSQQFKTTISLLSTLPDIDNSMNELVSNKIINLKGRYDTILKLIKRKCSGMVTKPACYIAAVALGPDIRVLYDILKINSDIPNFNIDETTLLNFINMVAPIMSGKLNNINEFKEALDELKDLINNNPDLIEATPVVSSTGGKNSANHAKPTKAPAKPTAKHTKKVILGKERCIYKVEGSKKEHIKHKGALIPVADYKKLMGAQ